MNNKNIILCSIIFLGFFLRLYTLIPNFTPVFSMCMFSGMMFEKSKKMFLVPLLAMFVTDMILGIHNTIFFVYFALLIVIYIGYLNTSKSSLKVLIPSIFVSNIAFFVITNFGVWLMQIGFYEKSLPGLIACYVAAIPFLKNALLSNLLFTPILLYSYKYIEKKYPVFIST